jgi:N-acyl homoserine lactone hydrolase
MSETTKTRGESMSRRNFLRSVAAMVGAIGLGAGGYSILGRNNASAAMQLTSELAPVAPVTITTASGIRVHGVQTGWITIKNAHYRLQSPDSLRFPGIIADMTWTEPKPMLSWVVEHPEGLIVIDTGERAGSRNLGTYLACADPGNHFFITRNFKVNVESESELGPQLVKLGLEPNDVRWVIQTHLHFDHADGFDFFSKAEVLVSRAELEGQRRQPVGAVSCLYPAGFNPVGLEYTPKSYENFAAYHALTKSEDVVIIPTHGHSYGHQSILLRDNRQTFLFAGDVVFDERQLLAQEMAGIVHDVAEARSSMEESRSFIASTPTIFLPSHDPESLRRLETKQITEVRS